MLTDDLIAYVKAQKEQGKTKEHILCEGLDKGFHEQELEEACDYLRWRSANPKLQDTSFVQRTVMAVALPIRALPDRPLLRKLLGGSYPKIRPYLTTLVFIELFVIVLGVLALLSIQLAIPYRTTSLDSRSQVSLDDDSPLSGSAYQTLLREEKTCGNGILDSGEVCDLAITDTCGTCDDQNACTVNVKRGTDCQTTCTFEAITTCTSNDGCCPEGCSTIDNDCVTKQCTTNNQCDDANSCTIDQCLSSQICWYNPITQCVTGDGCCASGCHGLTDADCSKKMS
ncbi:hypothetical protein HYW21_04490 [Candidatus Woesearchaeota archaeon]|nr:hypothetical protein [Candidatus Woesearchaeota archaeon]